jgi:hypothetical protein
VAVRKLERGGDYRALKLTRRDRDRGDLPPIFAHYSREWGGGHHEFSGANLTKFFQSPLHPLLGRIEKVLVQFGDDLTVLIDEDVDDFVERGELNAMGRTRPRVDDDLVPTSHPILTFRERPKDRRGKAERGGYLCRCRAGRQSVGGDYVAHQLQHVRAHLTVIHRHFR